MYIYIYTFKASYNFLACLGTVFSEGTLFCVVFRIYIYIYIYTFKASYNFPACLGTVFPERTLFCVSKFNEKEVKTKSELTYK